MPGACDVITDFSVAENDRIDLCSIDANPETTAIDTFTYISTTDFTGVSGQLRFAAGDVFADLNGDRIADFQIHLNNVTSLSPISFLL